MIFIKALEQKILSEGQVFPGNVLKVGSFLNHQLDVDFLMLMGEEIKNIYKNEKITLDEAKALSQEILKRLYTRLTQYEWFIFCCESTSAKGIHIYTHSAVPEFDVEYLEDGTNRWIDGMDKEDYVKYCIKYRNT